MWPGANVKSVPSLDMPPSPSPDNTRELLEGVMYEIEKIVNADSLITSRKMVESLGWERRRDYIELFQNVERLGQFRDIDSFDTDAAPYALRSVSNYFKLLRPDTVQYFDGLWHRSPKTWTLGYTIGGKRGFATGLSEFLCEAG